LYVIALFVISFSGFIASELKELLFGNGIN